MALHIAAGFLLVVIAYVMGSIPFAIVIGKWFWHVDVRDHGSGNVGTTNVFRVLGKRAGALVLTGDMAKGFIPVFLASQLAASGYFPDWFPLIVALAALLGHMFSLFLRGGGGKGVATGAGIVLALVPVVFVIALCVFLLVLVVSRMVSLASMCAALTFAIGTIAFDKPVYYEVLAVVAALVVIFAHRSNIRRIALRCESKVTFPWNRPSQPGGPRPAGDGQAQSR
jgi:acyl phosphate:glycerol-3-phosphate acyltransferase